MQEGHFPECRVASVDQGQRGHSLGPGSGIPAEEVAAELIARSRGTSTPAAGQWDEFCSAERMELWPVLGALLPLRRDCHLPLAATEPQHIWGCPKVILTYHLTPRRQGGLPS